MSFQPVIPASGYAGWRFLARTGPGQRELAAEAPANRRDTVAFRERIGRIASAEELVADRALLRVALGAFGLEGDLGNRAFVRKVLESSPADAGSLANRLADKRYLDFARSFGFAAADGPYVRRAGFADGIVGAYETRRFEVAVGEKDQALRLALTATRELEALAARRATPDARWFAVLGNPPLRKVFEAALGLPRNFGVIDIDRQVDILREKSARAFGTGEVAGFADAARREDVVRLFLLRGEADAPGRAGPSVALALLRGSGGSPALLL